MANINKKVHNKWRRRTKSFLVLERKLVESFVLERKVFRSKEIPKRCKEYSERQFIVFMVSCLEDFLKNKFKEFVDAEIIKLDVFVDKGRWKNLKFNLNQVSNILRNNSKLSDILITELNFQNFSDICLFGDAIGFMDYYENITNPSRESFGFTKEESEESINQLGKSLDNDSNSFDSDIKFVRVFVRNIGRVSSNKDLDKMLGTLNTAINLRHRIVHNAELVELPHEYFSIGLIMAIVTFTSAIEEIYNIKMLKKKKFISKPSPLVSSS